MDRAQALAKILVDYRLCNADPDILATGLRPAFALLESNVEQQAQTIKELRQSLSAIRNEAMEECAKYLDGNHYLEIGVSPSEAIRNLKTDPQLTEEE